MARTKKVGTVPSKKSTVREPKSKNEKAPSEKLPKGGRRSTVAAPKTAQEAYKGR